MKSPVPRAPLSIASDRMTSTIAARYRDRESGIQYPAPNGSRHQIAVARRMRCLPSTAAKYLSSGVLERKVADMLTELVDAGDQQAIARIMRPIDAALAGVRPEALTKALQHTAQQLDLAEDLAESAYGAAPSRDTLRAWQLARLKARAIDRTLDAAIAEELAR